MSRSLCFTAVICTAAVLVSAVPAIADVIYEDVFYWAPDGFGGIEVSVNPSAPPIDAYLKIQETVYDDAQGRSQLDLMMNLIHAVHGDSIPTQDFDLYVYSITNLNYNPTPPQGEIGHGVAGYALCLEAGVNVLGIWGPDYANVWWRTGTESLNIVWDIDADHDGLLGDGWGIVQGQTFAGFMIAVPAGTPHSLEIGAGAWSWTGEEPSGVEFGDIYGYVSGPTVPEPATFGLLGLGIFGLVTRRKRK